MKRPRKIRAFNRVQPRMTEEDQRRQQFISPSKHKLNPYLMMHFTRTEQYTAGTAVPPWGNSIVYMNGLNSTAAFGVPSITNTACDTYYSSVSLLLLFNGTNNSIVFTDSSPSPKTITRNGDAQISTAQSKWGGSSGLFDGNGDFVSAPAISSGIYDLGVVSSSTQFTVEAWIYPTSFPSLGMIASHAVAGSGGSGRGGWYFNVSPSGKLVFAASKLSNAGTGWFAYFETNSTVLTLNTWHFVALVINNGVPKIYVNGAEQASTFATPNSAYATSIIGFDTTRNDYGLIVGALGTDSTNPSPSNFYSGYIDDLRVTQGVARYTSNFTVPSKENPTAAC